MRNFPCQTVDNNIGECLAWGMSKANGCFQIFDWQQHFPITEHHKSENFPRLLEHIQVRKKNLQSFWRDEVIRVPQKHRNRNSLILKVMMLDAIFVCLIQISQMQWNLYEIYRCLYIYIYNLYKCFYSPIPDFDFMLMAIYRHRSFYILTHFFAFAQCKLHPIRIWIENLQNLSRILLHSIDNPIIQFSVSR